MSRYQALKDDPTLWLPVYTLEVVSEIGQEWPTGVVVTKYEENYRDEKRYVGTEMYVRNPEP